MTPAEWDEMSQQMGFDARQAYRDYSDRIRTTPSYGWGRQRIRSQEPMDEDSWARWTWTAVKATYGWDDVVRVVEQDWEASHGTKMPEALRQQIIQAIQQAPEHVQQILQAATDLNVDAKDPSDPRAALKSQGQALLSKGGFIDEIVANFEKTHDPTGKAAIDTGPQSADAAVKRSNQAVESLYRTFRQALGRDPNQNEILRLAGASEDALNQYLDNQPSPVKGLTYGVYHEVQGRMQPLWRQYFGRDPTPKELTWGTGRDPKQIQEYIDEQPSHVDGVTIGRYRALSEFGQKVAGDLGVAGDDRALVERLGKL